MNLEQGTPINYFKKNFNKRNITDIKDQTKKIACLGCAIQKGDVKSPGGSIVSK